MTETVRSTVSLDPDSIVPLTCSTLDVKPLQSAACEVDKDTVMSSSPVLVTVISYSAGLSESASRVFGDADIETSTAACADGEINESKSKTSTKRADSALFMVNPGQSTL